MNIENVVKIVDHSVYGNLVSGIMYVIFTLLFIFTLKHPNSNKTRMTIIYQITYFFLAAMFLVFTVEHKFKYNFDGSPVTLKMLLLFGCFFLLYLSTGLSWTKTYYEDKGASGQETAKNIQYTNGIFTILIGLLFAIPALTSNWIDETPWFIFGIGYALLGCTELYFSANPKANRYLYLIPFLVLNISFIAFVLKIALHYNNLITALRDSVMALICGQIITVLLKEIVSKENERKIINWMHFFILFTFSIVHITIFRLNPDRFK